MLGEHMLGKTVILMNGAEDVITGLLRDDKTFLSETRSWDVKGNSLDGGAEQCVLGVKQAHLWRIGFVGYGRTDGSYTARSLDVSTQLLALQTVKAYNDRVKGYLPNGMDSFVHAGASIVNVYHDPCQVFEDDAARDVIASDEVYDLRWMWKQRQNVDTPGL